MGETGDMSIILIDAAMLGDLGGTASIDDALDGAHDDIWDGRIFGWVAEAFGDQSRTVDDVCDPEVKTGRIETCHSFAGIGGVCKEDESNVVGCCKRNINAAGCWYQ
jgi:hypothetical protein